jgi:hypothetical protein
MVKIPKFDEDKFRANNAPMKATGIENNTTNG